MESLRGKTHVSRTLTMLTLATLPDILEQIADRDWAEGGGWILTYTLYLLCLKGGAFESTWDYAAEVLRLFWQALLPGKERQHVRRFTRQYSVWCGEFILRAGLAEAEAAELAGAQASQAPSPGAPFRDMRISLSEGMAFLEGSQGGLLCGAAGFPTTEEGQVSRRRDGP